ncbi:MAG: hypothetical protein L3J41_17475 [Melioribacteraceae bacterium]|nr:hypothetical protein [Melioribacteraceae bacterium]
MKNIKILLIALNMVFVITLISCSSSKKTLVKEISGKIYLLGSEPFTNYGIEDSNGTAYIIMKVSPVYTELNKLQGKTVLVIVDMKKSLSWDEIYIKKIISNQKE